MGVLEQFSFKKSARLHLVSIPGRDLGVLELNRSTETRPVAGFNPWKGFGGFGTPCCCSPFSGHVGFNPWKGFGGFGTGENCLLQSSQSRFQSLEGIWGFWNDIRYARAIDLQGFNPWKGFGGFGTPERRSEATIADVSIPGRDLGVLERHKKAVTEEPADRFQSLEGIWGFWNVPSYGDGASTKEVSIPGRDLGVLEQLSGDSTALVCLVSIPGRDLGVLERPIDLPDRSDNLDRFQSLEGIWGFWNMSVYIALMEKRLG